MICTVINGTCLQHATYISRKQVCFYKICLVLSLMNISVTVFTKDGLRRYIVSSMCIFAIFSFSEFIKEALWRNISY